MNVPGVEEVAVTLETERGLFGKITGSGSTGAPVYTPPTR